MLIAQGARNICTKDAVMSELLASADGDSTTTPSQPTAETTAKRTVLIFHCEFSSERAPKLYVLFCRFLQL